MKTGPMDNPDQIIKQYLLGQLSDSDKENLEHEYFVEAVALRKVEMGEDELIDEYLDKQLSPDERQSFLQIFLTTKDREEKLRLAKALREKVRKNAGGLGRMSRRLRIPSALLVRLGLGAIAASLILIAGLGWLLTHEIWQVRSLHSERRTWAEQESELQDRLAQADAENTRLDERVTQGLRARAELQAQVQRLEARASTPRKTSAPRNAQRSFSVRLTRSALRSGGNAQPVKLPANALLLEFQMELAVEAADYGSFQAQLIRVDRGSQIVQNSLLRRRQGEPRLIRFAVGSDLLSPGDYSIELGGFSKTGSLKELGEYVFRLTR